jgi:chitosanase
MSITADQRYAIDCVLSIFETGRMPSAKSYSTCTVLPDGAGISYGKHQATDRSDSLDLILSVYIAAGGKYAPSIQSFVPRLKSNETAAVDPKNLPSWVKDLMDVLAAAGTDPIMQKAQDDVFDKGYWKPAADLCARLGIKTALGHLVIYDTCIHSGIGGVGNIRKMFPDPSPANGGTEHSYIRTYVNSRRIWMASHSKVIIQRCVYRMDALLSLMNEGNWDLRMPFLCRGIKVEKR